MERTVQHPLRPDAAPDPLSGAGPGAAARDAARCGLYVHVPFCAVRCTYCHFSTVPLTPAGVERWLAALEREAALRSDAAAGARFTSVFLGGGTPSTLAPAAIARLFRALRGAFTIAPEAEITLEANPESASPARLGAWRQAGVNRLSLGVQSFDPGELTALGRAHDAERPQQVIAHARAAGFERLSLDLMFGFPGHTPARFASTLERALALDCEHLSAYSFIVEAGNPLSDDVLAGRARLPDDDAQAELYECWLERSAVAGLLPYETSNVARPGAEARHNLTYWLRRDALGLGPSAHSLWRGERWANRHDTADWLACLERGASPRQSREPVRAATTADEIVLLGLRLAGGLRSGDYPAGDWAEVESRYAAAFADAARIGRLVPTSEGWALPARHRFLADDTIAWLAARTPVDRASSTSLNSFPCPTPPSPAGSAPGTPNWIPATAPSSSS